MAEKPGADNERLRDAEEAVKDLEPPKKGDDADTDDPPSLELTDDGLDIAPPPRQTPPPSSGANTGSGSVRDDAADPDTAIDDGYDSDDVTGDGASSVGDSSSVINYGDNDGIQNAGHNENDDDLIDVTGNGPVVDGNAAVPVSPGLSFKRPDDSDEPDKPGKGDEPELDPTEGFDPDSGGKGEGGQGDGGESAEFGKGAGAPKLQIDTDQGFGKGDTSEVTKPSPAAKEEPIEMDGVKTEFEPSREVALDVELDEKSHDEMDDFKLAGEDIDLEHELDIDIDA